MLNRNVPYGGIGVFWVREVHMKGFQNGEIRCIVRPGDRTDPTKSKGNPVGVPIPVRFISKPGNPDLKTDPEFYPDDGTTVMISRFFAKPVDELTPEDLMGAASDYATPELVIEHLTEIYPDWRNAGDVVTVTRFVHLPKVTE